MNFRTQFVALLLVAASTLYASREITVTPDRPVPQADENVQVEKETFPSCERLSELYFCTAHGTRIRTCFVELSIKKQFVVAEFEPIKGGGGWYSSNECSARASLGHELCKNGIESSHFNEMTCYSKK